MTLLLALCCATSLLAQPASVSSFTVKGQVMDSLSNESVPYATMKFALAAAPQQAVKMLATDDDGKFEAILNAPGDYVVTIQFVGKLPAEKKFTLMPTDKTKNLGIVYMTENTQQLEQVTVTAQKPLVKVDIDKITYSMEEDPESKVNNTLDMLRKVPMITIDGDDKIQLKGSSNFKIYMDGKPSNLLSNNPSEVLKSIPASSVKDIEVITDPGAKYDAEGVGGIINIITYKNSRLQGITGTVRVNASDQGSFGGGGYASAKVGNLGITANFNYSQQNSPWSENESEQLNLVNDDKYQLLGKGRNKNKGPFMYGYLEASYEIDSLNLVSVSANIFDVNMKNISESQYNLFNKSGNPVYDYERYSETRFKQGSTDLSVDYQRSTRKKDELFTLSYRFSDSPYDSESYTELRNVNNYDMTNMYPMSILNDASTTEHTGQIDYTTPLFKGHTFEGGVKYINRQSRSETDRIINKVSTEAANSDFRHTQHIYSGYLGYTMRIKKVGIKAGIRAEGTALDVAYKKDPTRNFDTHYFDIVPNATLSYQLGMTQQLRLGYNMRIYRPGIWYLNPYVNDSNPEHISYGNPNLDSEKSHSINLNYSYFAQKFNMNASFSHSFVNNSIESYTIVDPENSKRLITTYDNIGHQSRTGGYVYASWNPIALLRIYVNAGLNYVDMESVGIGNDQNKRLSNNGFSGNVSGGGQVTLPKDFRINVNGYYSSPWVSLQGEGSGYYYVAFSASKDFLKKKLTVSVSAQNPFWKTIDMKNTSIDSTFESRNTNYRIARSFSISASYRFGSLKEQIKKVRRGISNDDQKGGGSAGGSGEGSAQ
ncbi:outer membrane receptor for ferrienterochelin and colicin [Parabacteroides sp. PFB2-12]|nr:outer membrane receptor for ferrienterochelin and colicin [Parabacteroides sp. PFB2-12]